MIKKVIKILLTATYNLDDLISNNTDSQMEIHLPLLKEQIEDAIKMLLEYDKFLEGMIPKLLDMIKE